MRVVGENGIYAELVQHSADDRDANNEVLTVNVKYGLIIHAEFLRHRQLSRGVKSNRAIPMKKIRAEVINDPYVPVWFGAAKRGMVSSEEVKYKGIARGLWLKSRYVMCGVHWLAEKFGAHKEWANRLLNPWQFVRETITATEWDNLFALRLDDGAQRDIKEVVRCIYELKKRSNPTLLVAGQWHVPYIYRAWVTPQSLSYFSNQADAVLGVRELTLEEAIKCSAARCARSSYDNHDGSAPDVGKDLELYSTLIDSTPVHASPVEHPCTPMEVITSGIWGASAPWEKGVTHLDRGQNYWSGNMKGFIQYRQLVANNV